MSEANTVLVPDAKAPGDTSTAPLTAGQMLKAAREAAGMHIAALSVALKVPVRKLELLEADAHDQLPGSTFTRALAQSVCRALKMDAAPVLALLPNRQDAGLDHAVIGGARRDAFAASTPPAHAQHAGGPTLPKPVLWVAASLVAVAAALWLLPPLSAWSPQALLGVAPQLPQVTVAPTGPAGVTGAQSERQASGPEKSTSLESGSGLQASPMGAPSVPAADVAVSGVGQGQATKAAAPLAAPYDRNATLQLKANAPSWVEVKDAAGSVVYTGTVVPGVPVGVELKSNGQLVVGNAASTEVMWRGRQVDVVGAARDNVARVELK